MGFKKIKKRYVPFCLANIFIGKINRSIRQELQNRLEAKLAPKVGLSIVLIF